MTPIPLSVLVLCAVLAGTSSDANNSRPCPRANTVNQAVTLVPVTYAVADLVVPVDALAKNPKTIEATLMTIICNAIDPSSWAGSGGEATIQYYPLGMALIVRQIPANQEMVAELLTSLRRLQDVEVAVEVRLVTLAPDTAEHLVNLTGFKEFCPNDPRRSIEGVFLNDKQVRSWLNLAMNDRVTNAMQLPKITLFNGQNAALKLDRDLSFEVLPVVSADRRFVRLHLDATCRSVTAETRALTVPHACATVERCVTIDEVKLNKVLTLPDGQTFVCRFGKLSESLLLKDGSLFEEREVFLMVTTRVLVTEVELPLCETHPTGGFDR
jgi:hypothetical protein